MYRMNDVIIIPPENVKFKGCVYSAKIYIKSIALSEENAETAGKRRNVFGYNEGNGKRKGETT